MAGHDRSPASFEVTLDELQIGSAHRTGCNVNRNLAGGGLKLESIHGVQSGYIHCAGTGQLKYLH